MPVNEPAPILISRTDASKQLVALSKLHRFRNVSFAVAEVIPIGGDVSSSSPGATVPTNPSNPKAEFGGVSLLVFCVTQFCPAAVKLVVQPAGRLGTEAVSKFSLNPAGEHWSLAVQTFPSSH